MDTHANMKHVDESEARDALDPDVGDGTPDTAPFLDTDDGDWQEPGPAWRKWMPTRKWWAATITGAGTVAVMLWTGDGINTDEEKILVIGLAIQRLVSYVTPNDDTIGGVPE